MNRFSLENFLTLLKNTASTYATNKVFILGKGPSIDIIDPAVYADSLVIAINDAEAILPADITVFNAPWVEKSLHETGHRSQLYVCPRDFDSGGKDVITAPYIPLFQSSSDMMMQRFMSDDFVIEDVLFITALKIARLIATVRDSEQDVYMVGFDFNSELGISNKMGYRASPDAKAEEGLMRIDVQEYYLINVLYFLRGSDVSVKHVGYRSFSALTPEELNATSVQTATPLPHSGDVHIVAELTTNHFGDRVRLERMIRSAKSAGADYIKVQKRDVETFYTQEQLDSPYISPFGKTFRDYRYQLELDRDDFAFIDSLCRNIGIGWFASVLDEPSFDFMMDFQMPFIKLPSTISERVDYLNHVAKNYTGGLVLSTGMTTVQYETFILDSFVKCAPLYLLQCNSAYPTPLHDCHIGVVRHYHGLSLQYPHIIPGYSSHDQGWKASALAVAAGARMVEKHVKLGNTEWAHFDAVAVDLTTSEFREFVNNIRETEMILGHTVKQINASEHHKY